MELVEIITNAGAMGGVAYLALSWNRADTIAHREKLAELNNKISETQRLTAEALQRLADTLDVLNERITRIEERTKTPRRTTKKEV
ncbi:MAG: hypothetical protein IPK82_23550 [Polyangiaceae bacterium]|nr:hypothetical protein [Polyangiaceae bacterium]